MFLSSLFFFSRKIVNGNGLLALLPTVYGSAFVAAIAFRQPNIAQKTNSSTTVEPILVSRHNANAMLYAAFFWLL